MFSYGRQVSTQFKNEEQKQILNDLNIKRSDILLLKNKLNKKIEWPLKIKLEQKAKAKNTTLKQKKKHRKFTTKALDPFSHFIYAEDAIHKHKYNEASEDYLNEFIDHFTSHQIKPKPTEEISDNTKLFLQDKALDTLDKLLLNITNVEYSDKTSQTPDWEYIVANMLQLGLPPSVIDRVKRKMALITGKDTPAITAMNVAPIHLSDLTMTSIEEEMKGMVTKMLKKNELFEPYKEDDPIESPTKWLVDLDKKDFETQKEEIEKIEKDFTARVLDLKPAFF